MKFEIEIKDGITYIVRHTAGGDLVEIKSCCSEKAVKGFIRRIKAVKPEMRKSA